MWRYQWFHWYQVCLSLVLKLVGVSSKHIRVFLESLRQSLDIFGKFRMFSRKCSGMFVNAFGTILENLWKIIKNSHHYVCITLHVSSKIWSEFYVLVARTISRPFAALTGEILFLPLERKITSSRHREISSISHWTCTDSCANSCALLSGYYRWLIR